MSDIPVFLAPILEDLSSSRSSSNRRRRALTKLDGLLATLCLPKIGETPHETEERDRIKQVFVELQDGVDGNVASILVPLASRLLPQFHSQVVNSANPNEFQPTLSELVGIFQIIQGVCLLHQPSKNLIGSRRSTMEMILDLLLLTRHVPSSPAALSSSARPDLPLSSLLASTLLDTLFAVLVDSSRNTRTFEQAGGLECLMRMLKGKTVPKDIRMRSLEFIFFYLLPEGQAGTNGQMVGASGVDHQIELRGGIDIEDLPILLASPRQGRPSSDRLADAVDTTTKENKIPSRGNVPSTPDSSRMYRVETPSTQVRAGNNKYTPRPTPNSHTRRPSTPSSAGSPTSQQTRFDQISTSVVGTALQRSTSPSPRRVVRPTDLQPSALITTAPGSYSGDSVAPKRTTASIPASHGLGISTSFPSPRRAYVSEIVSTSKSGKIPAARPIKSGSELATPSSFSSTAAAHSDREGDSKRILSTNMEKTRGRPVSHARSTSPVKASSERVSETAARVSQISNHFPKADQSSIGISNLDPATDHRPVIQIRSPSKTSSRHETPSRSRRITREGDEQTTVAPKMMSDKSPVQSTPRSRRLDEVVSTKIEGLEQKEDLFSSPRATASRTGVDPKESNKDREHTRSSGLMLPPKDIPAHRRAASASRTNTSDSTMTPSLTGPRRSQSSTRRVQTPAEPSTHKPSSVQPSFSLHNVPSPSIDHSQPVEESFSVHPVFLSSSQTLPPNTLPLPSPTMSNSTVSPSIASDGSLSPYVTPTTSPYLLSASHLSPDPSLPPSSSSPFSLPSRSPSKSPRIRQSRPPNIPQSPKSSRSDTRWGNTVDSKSIGMRTVQEKKALLSVYLGDLDRLMGTLGTSTK